MITVHPPIQPGGTTVTWHCDRCRAEAHVKTRGDVPTGWHSTLAGGDTCPAH